MSLRFWMRGTLTTRVLRFFVVAFLVLHCAGCGAPPSRFPQNESDADATSAIRLLPAGDRPQFRFRALDGREVSSEVALGRNSVVAFLATFDWASQAQARFVSGIAQHHQPKTNCYAVVLELPENDLLVASFVDTLSLSYPVAHVTSETLAKTPLRVPTVPTVLVFDTGGNVMWRSRGLATEDEIEQVLRAVERDRPAGR